MEYGQAVVYVGDAGKESLAFVTDFEGGQADLVVLGADGVGVKKNVARRAPKDFGPEGGGHTFHLRAEA